MFHFAVVLYDKPALHVTLTVTVYSVYVVAFVKKQFFYAVNRTYKKYTSSWTPSSTSRCRFEAISKLSWSSQFHYNYTAATFSPLHCVEKIDHRLMAITLSNLTIFKILSLLERGVNCKQNPYNGCLNYLLPLKMILVLRTNYVTRKHFNHWL